MSQLPAPVGAPVPVPRGDMGRLPKGTKPEGYKLRFELFPERESFRGEARISVRLESASPVVVLHAKGLTFDSVTARQGTRSFKGVSEVTDEVQGEVALRFESPIGAGFAELVLAYHAPFSGDLEGMYRVREAGMNAVFTQFEPTSARRAFPCFDEPALKTPFEVEVLTSKNDVAFSNGAEASHEEVEGGVLYRFEKTAPIPSYLVAVAAGPLESQAATSSLEGTDIRTIALRGRAKDGAYANEAATRLLAAAATYTGIPYAYGKLDIVAVPNFNAGAMENPGLVTFREERLLLRSPSLRTRYSTESIIAHEFAHQWFGDYVTAKWWDEVWLNEAFATWMAAKLLDGQTPANFKAIRDAKVSAAWVMDDDSMSSAHAIRAPITSAASAMEAFDGITYDKGAAVLRMLERDVGTEPFQRGLHRYLSTHPHGSAGFEDLWAAIVHEAPPAPPLRKGRFQGYLDHAGVPDIDIRTRCDGGHPIVQMKQSPFVALGTAAATDKHVWDIPVCFEQNGKTQCVDLSTETLEKTFTDFACNKPLVPNAQMEGYYRFSLPEEALPALATESAPETRIALLLNVWAHTRNGRYAPKVLFATLSRFANEKDPQVVSTLAKVLAKVGDTLVTDGSRSAYATLVTNTLAGAAKRFPLGAVTAAIGAHESQARRDVWTTLFDHGTPSTLTLKQAQDRADRALASAEPGTDRDGDELAIELRARQGNERYWATLVERLAKGTDPQERVVIVRALASFDDETLLGRTLTLALDGTIKLQDLRYLVHASIQRPRARSGALTWYDRHWDVWLQKLPAHQAARIVSIMPATCGSALKESLTKKMESALPTFVGWGRTYRSGVETAKTCEALRAQAGTETDTVLSTKRFR